MNGYSAVAALLAAMPDPAAEVELWRRECRAAASAAFAEGYRLGYEAGARLRETEWPAVTAPLAGPTLAELELRRYGPGGRERFGEQRPTDRISTALATRAGAA